MKTKNIKKVVISTMALAMGAALAGSISGTVAWYQYSTRSTVALSGASAHCTESLQVKIGADGTWKQDLLIADVQAYIATARGSADYGLRPVTSGELAENAVATSFYKNPIYQYAETAKWGLADNMDYVTLPLYFRVGDVNGARDSSGNFTTFLAKKLYLTDLTVAAKTVDGKQDITDALRVSFDASNDKTYSVKGADVDVFGKLDLNNDGTDDQTFGYEWTTGRTDIIYGDNEKVAKSTKIEAANLADDSDPLNITGTHLLETAASADGSLVTVRIYLEGWQKLGTTPSALWNDVDFVGAEFNIGMRFTAEAHSNH